MLQLTAVIKAWNARWGIMENLRVEQANDTNPQNGNYAQIGFSAPAEPRNALLWDSHYEFLQKTRWFKICFHKEERFDGVNDPRLQNLVRQVRAIESRIKCEMRAINVNIDGENIINPRTTKSFKLDIRLPSCVEDAELACDCMEKLISITYRRLEETLGEPAIPEFGNIAKKCERV